MSATVTRRPDGTVEVRTEAGIWAIDPEIAAELVAPWRAHLEEVLAVAWPSWDGDHWYAQEAGIPYEVAERRLKAASEFLRAIQGGTPAGEDPSE